MKMYVALLITSLLFIGCGSGTEDDAYASSQEYTLYTQEETPITFTVVPNAIEETVEYSDTAETTNTTDSSVTVITIDKHPENGKLSLAGESVTYTPFSNFNGREVIALHLGDPSDVNYKIYNIVIFVESDGEAPMLSGNPTTQIKVNDNYSFRPNVAKKFQTNTMVFSIANKPYWASFNGNTGELYGKAPSEEILTENIVISLFNGQDRSSLEAFDIEVFDPAKKEDTTVNDTETEEDNDSEITTVDADEEDNDSEITTVDADEEDNDSEITTVDADEDVEEETQIENDPTDKGDNIL
ncbi:MAG: Unknown protein [uncultured Sulfurovum sp.]|uniref:Uncharacterized protein n=1 Tax=uncultured Sulfurovum sp. TaxID=269237 RepID=A0A6S6SVG1_9BACT|nr:MAG: Unknown protein [uncultured Sulfurovum sp.]